MRSCPPACSDLGGPALPLFAPLCPPPGAAPLTVLPSLSRAVDVHHSRRPVPHDVRSARRGGPGRRAGRGPGRGQRPVTAQVPLPGGTARTLLTSSPESWVVAGMWMPAAAPSHLPSVPAPPVCLPASPQGVCPLSSLIPHPSAVSEQTWGVRVLTYQDPLAQILAGWKETFWVGADLGLKLTRLELGPCLGFPPPSLSL